MKRILNLVSKICLVVTTFVFSVLMVGGQIAFDNKNMVSSFLGEKIQDTIKDPNAASKDLEYYKSSFETVKEEKDSAKRYVETIEAEGATLLKNAKKDGSAALPLKKQATVSLFSSSAVNPVLSGSGCGGGSGESVSLMEGLGAAGLEVNADLYYWYEDNLNKYGRKNVNGSGGVGTVANISDVRWDEITVAAKTRKADAAIFVLSRTGGEGIDSTLYAKDNRANVYNNNVTYDYKDGNYLKLNDTERDVLQHLAEEREKGTFGSVIILLNTTNQVQLDFLDDIYADGVMWVGSFGSQGAYAIGDLLAGNVNPSGKLPDTFWKKHYLNPVHANYGSLVSAAEDPEITQWKIIGNANNMASDGRHIVYQEGIYMGYRYTETRYEDTVLKDKENVGTFVYDDVVSYPFGYGLSYTTFEYSNLKAERTQANTANGLRDTVWNISVTVKNTGTVAGKEAVQIYLQKPYTEYDKQNGIEKAAVELVGFEKTKLLEPNTSETLTVKVEERNFASYDAYKEKTYIVDEGNYYFTAAPDSHAAVNNILAAKGKTLADGMTAEGNANMVYRHTVSEFDASTYSKSVITKNEITNRFDNADLNIYDNTGANKVQYVTRSNWNGTVKFGLTDDNERTYNQFNVTVTEQMKKDLAESWNGAPEEGKGGDYPVYGSTETAYTLVMLRAYDDGDDNPDNDVPVPYNDPMWDALLDQLTWDETVAFLSDAGYGNGIIESVSKPFVIDHDGGNGVVQRFNVNEKNNGGLAVRTDDPDKSSSPELYPSNAIAAATYNKELCNYYGRQWGEDCLWSGVGGLYGMGMNTHRSPYGGRNFEYYSEDPVLMGQIAAEMADGMRTRGAYVYLKHIGLNDQETYRCGGFTWANEQSIREIYMKSFQIAIEDGGAQSVMTSLNSIGTQWSGCQGFLNTVLRDEFGLTGHVVTDSLGCHNAEFSRGLYYGNDLPLGGYRMDNGVGKGFDFAKPQSEGGAGEYGKYAWAMRESVHRVLYTVVHSYYMNGIAATDRIVQLTPGWMSAVTGLQAAFGVLFGLSAVAYVASVVLNRKELF